MKYNVMTIDPGISGTGIAFWDEKQFYDQRVDSVDKNYWIRPIKAFILSFKDQDKYIEALKKVANLNKVKIAFIEDASHMEGAKGHMVSSSGNLVTLAEFIGRMKEMFYREGINCQLIKVANWKGNLPKEVVWRRIKRVWPACTAESHALDAVGIGFYLAGCINQ